MTISFIDNTDNERLDDVLSWKTGFAIGRLVNVTIIGSQDSMPLDNGAQD